MAEGELIVYGTDWCGDCRRARRFLNQRGIPYRWVNIDGDREAEALVRKLNCGNRSVPTLVFSDGSVLVEPGEAALERRFGAPA